MATPKSTATKKKTTKTSDTDPKYVGTDTLQDNTENMAQAALHRVKDAVPSMDDITGTIQDRTNVDLQNMADDATAFVRRNPGVSLAAAAGVGILIGILATKRT